MTGYEWLILAGLIIVVCSTPILVWALWHAPHGEETANGFRKLNNNHKGDQ